MHRHVNEMPSVGYNAVYATSNNRFSLAEAAAVHARVEAACDDLIQRQDALIRVVALRCRPPKPETGDLARAVLSEMTHGARAQGEWSEGIPHDTFAPLATANFVQEASTSEAERIEDYEFEIAQLRSTMRKIETEIETYSPVTPSDIARKLKFLSGLLIDGGEVDLDDYARLAEIASGMLLDGLETSGFF